MSQKLQSFTMETPVRNYDILLQAYTENFTNNETFVSLKPNSVGGVATPLFIAENQVITIKSARVDVHGLKGARIPGADDKPIEPYIALQVIDDGNLSVLLDNISMNVARYEEDFELNTTIQIPKASNGKVRIVPFPGVPSVYKIDNVNVQSVYDGKPFHFQHYLEILSSKEYLT